MKAEIICVGTELLLGDVLNTNGKFLSQELNRLGYDVYRETTVGDNPYRIESLKRRLRTEIWLFLQGGLGPTEDDITKETVAKTLGQKLVLHQESWQWIKDFSKPMILR